MNLFDPDVLARPHAFYRQALAEAPVMRVPGTVVYLIASHALVAEACGRPQDFSNDISSLLAGVRSDVPEVKAVLDTGWPQQTVLLMADPPAHGRYRRLVNLAFSLKRVDAIEHRTREEQKLARSYRAGQVVELSRPLTSQGLPQGRMEVVEVGKKGEIGVRLASGRTATFRPDRLAGNRVADAVAVFEKRDIRLHEGDPIRWTANDRDRGLVNSERATLETRQQDALIFRLADDQLIRLERNDPMLKRIDLAYATNAHAAQGATADRAILVAQSTEGALINRSLVGVLFTRAREHISLVVDSIPSFERRAQAAAGEKTAAVEVAAANHTPPLVLPLPMPERNLDINHGSGKGPERDRDISFGM